MLLLYYDKVDHTIETLEQRIELVRDDREHGSRWLVREAIVILRDLAQRRNISEEERMHQLLHAGRVLAHARPAMAALSGAIGRMLHVQGGSVAVEREAECLLQEHETATQHIARYAAPFLQGRLMTCSISGTVLDVLLACRSSIESITALEGRPRYEGRDMARALGEHELAVTLITDAQADIFLPLCHAVVVGADSILANGDVLNKAGTALLGWAARGHGLPLYVLCETLKISPRRWSGADNFALLEEKEAEEVVVQPMPNVTVRNFYFDHTPYKLVKQIITERGVLDQRAIREIAAQARENERFLWKHLR